MIFHEAGHVLFLVFGEFLQILGGSLTQVLIPAACGVYFVLRRQPAAAALFWTGESLTNVAIYVADARRLALPLLGGDGGIHDWNYLLGRLGLLNQAEILGRLVFTVGGVTILGAVGATLRACSDAYLLPNEQLYRLAVLQIVFQIPVEVLVRAEIKKLDHVAALVELVG